MNAYLQITVDIAKTKAYYDALTYDQLCDCGHCKLYYQIARSKCPELAAWLDAKGIDIAKPMEIVGSGPDAKGMLDYFDVQYIVFGKCKKDFRVQVGDYTICYEKYHLDTGINEEHFVLSVYINLKFKLETAPHK